MKRLRSLLVFSGKLALTAGIFYLIFSRIDLEGFYRVLRQIDVALLLLTITIFFGSTCLQALAFRLILRAFGLPLPYRQVLKINYCSYFFSFLGDVSGGLARWAWFSGKKENIFKVFLAISVERFEIILVTLISWYWGLWAIRTQLPFSEREAFFRLALILGGFVTLVPFIMAAAAKGRHKIRWIHKYDAYLTELIACIKSHKTSLLASLGWMMCNTFVSIGCILLLCLSLHVRLPFLGLMWVVGLVVLAQSLPLTICGLGVREGVLIYALSKFGIGAETALAVGFTWFFVGLLMGLVGGVVFLAGSGLTRGKCNAAPV